MLIMIDFVKYDENVQYDKNGLKMFMTDECRKTDAQGEWCKKTDQDYHYYNIGE